MFGKSNQQREEEQEQRIAALEKQCGDLKEQNTAMKGRVDHLYDLLKTYEDVLINIRNNNAQIAALEQSAETTAFKVKKLEKRWAAVEASIQESSPSSQTLQYSQSAGEPDQVRDFAQAYGAGSEASDGGDAYTSIDYFDFENHFRGDRNLIKERQKKYLPYFKGCVSVVDIGCGRGEFLQLLKESGINATGVDTYDEFVEYCRDQNLEAVCDDGNHYLAAVDHTDGIFVGQVVEHMTTEQIVELCNLAWEKLEEGHYVIMETPNPTSLAIYTHAFYMDPSHVKPVHPKTMEYFLKKAGFKDVQIIYTPDSRLDETIPALEGDGIKNLEAFNQAMHTVSETLFGSQDYAIIAKK